MREKHDSALLGSGFIFQSMNSTVKHEPEHYLPPQRSELHRQRGLRQRSHSIGLAYMLIKLGLQDMVLAVGCRETNYYSMATFDALSAFSRTHGRT